MIRHRSSSAELLSSNYFFVVYPVSIQFQRDFNTRINLYFQKSVQIISKHQYPQQSIQKDQAVQFPNPVQVKHFRVPSQKNMEYSWSMYVLQMDDEGESEQFIEAQKITLKQEWSAFKSTKKPIFEQRLNFNTISCKLSYIVIIGSNNQEVLDLSQKYFSQLRNVDQKKVQGALEDLKVQSKIEQLQAQPLRNIQIVQTQHAVQNITETNKLEQNQEMKTSELKPQPSILQPNISLNDIQAHSTENFLQLLNQKQKPVQPQVATEKQIKEIKEEIVIQQATPKEQQTTPKEQQVFSNPQEQKPEKQVEQKITSSTNQETVSGQKQIVKPIYKQTKFLIVFLILTILVLTGGYSILSKNNAAVKQKGREDKKSKRQVNKNQSKKVNKKK